MSQPRYLLTSLASNDLAIGVLVTPFGFLPALFKCWPYSETLCQIQVVECLKEINLEDLGTNIIILKKNFVN
uniref:Uncharacterized protein n=1 Tax=Rhodnius prolixus TaxID=13249 RepID=T1HKJ1_RHOPR